MLSRNTVRESSHIFFFCDVDPLCEVERNGRRTHTGEPTGFWMTSGSPPSLEWPADLPSVQNYRPYIVFQVPRGNMNTPLRQHIFCLWLIIGTYTLPFFLVICWSYLRTEIFVILWTSNKLHSRHPSLFFSLSCETTLLMLSCDRIESAKFIHGTTSPAKLVYYTKFIYIYIYIYIRVCVCVCVYSKFSEKFSFELTLTMSLHSR